VESIFPWGRGQKFGVRPARFCPDADQLDLQRSRRALAPHRLGAVLTQLRAGVGVVGVLLFKQTSADALAANSQSGPGARAGAVSHHPVFLLPLVRCGRPGRLIRCGAPWSSPPVSGPAAAKTSRLIKRSLLIEPLVGLSLAAVALPGPWLASLFVQASDGRCRGSSAQRAVPPAPAGSLIGLPYHPRSKCCSVLEQTRCSLLT